MADKVIFRTQYNPFVSGTCYLAVFPNDEANAGRYGAVSFHFKEDGRAVFESYDEVSWDYYYNKTVAVHKNNPVIPLLLSAVQKHYDMPFKVAERIAKT